MRYFSFPLAEGRGETTKKINFAFLNRRNGGSIVFTNMKTRGM